MQSLLHLPVFLYHLLRCKYGISCLSARHETELLFSYAYLLPQSSVHYSFPNLRGMRYHLDASQALTLDLWMQWPGGPVDLKTYCPPQNLLAPQKTNWPLPQSQTCAMKKIFA